MVGASEAWEGRTYVDVAEDAFYSSVYVLCVPRVNMAVRIPGVELSFWNFCRIRSSERY